MNIGKLKTLIFFSVLFFIFSFWSSACGNAFKENKNNNSSQTSIKIITSFYPIYIMVLNIAKDIPNVSVENLAAQYSGCPHDFQLTTESMRKLSTAQILVINGLGLETFLEPAIKGFPELKIIDTSKNFTDRDSEINNPHIWTSITGAIEQTKSIADQLGALDPIRADAYKANSILYIQKLEALKTKMHSAIDSLPDRKIVTFHDAFYWFAKEFSLEVIAVVRKEPEEEPSAEEVASLIQTIRKKNVHNIFIEPQFPARTAETIMRETEADIFMLDPVENGQDNPDAYLEIMNKNLEVLKKALAK